MGPVLAGSVEDYETAASGSDSAAQKAEKGEGEMSESHEELERLAALAIEVPNG